MTLLVLLEDCYFHHHYYKNNDKNNDDGTPALLMMIEYDNNNLRRSWQDLLFQYHDWIVSWTIDLSVLMIGFYFLSAMSSYLDIWIEEEGKRLEELLLTGGAAWVVNGNSSSFLKQQLLE